MTDSKPGRLEFLDGLRGWGAVVVFFYHFLDRFLLSHLNGSWNPVLKNALDGRLAVYVFFVVSGFALSHMQLDEKRQNLPKAAVARYFRFAIPILITSFFAYLLMKFDLMFTQTATTDMLITENWIRDHFTFEPSISGYLRFSLFDVFFRYNFAGAYNSSLWTISYELLGSYVVYGLIGVLALHRSWNWPFVIGAALVLMIVSPILSCFIAGLIMAYLHRNLEVRKDWRFTTEVVCLCLLAVGVLLNTVTADSDRQMAFIAILAVSAITYSTPLRYLMETPISRYLGKISFPLYLVHLFVICSWSAWLYQCLWSSSLGYELSIAVNVASTAIITFAAATALVPMETWATRTSKRIADLLIKIGARFNLAR